MATPIKTIQDEMREAHERLQGMVAVATAEDREFTGDEERERDSLLNRMNALDAKRKRGESFTKLLDSVHALVPTATPTAAPAPSTSGNGGGVTWYAAGTGPNPAPKSLGAQYVASDVYAQLRAIPKTGRWQTPVVEILDAVTINPPGTLVPGGTSILPVLPYPTDWGVAGLFTPGTLDGGMVQYLQETVWTNAAAVVPAGQPKPESTKTFELKQQGLVKIAHWIGCPDEFLDDVAGLRSFIDAQMRNGVVEKLNNELVNGTGGGGIQGLITLPGKTADVVAGTAVGADAQAIAQQRAAIYQASRLQPDAVVMNPKTWGAVSSAMSTAGGYLAGPNTFGAGVPPQVWGLRVVETPEVPDGTAIVGAFKQGGQLYTKGGVAVQATNAHDDFFVRNITAIRAEIRVALVIYRPQAFGLVTSLGPEVLPLAR